MGTGTGMGVREDDLGRVEEPPLGLRVEVEQPLRSLLFSVTVLLLVGGEGR